MEKTNRLLFLALTALLLFPAIEAQAKKSKASPPTDQISVIGHVPAAGGPVTGFLTTQHYSSVYLYAEHAGRNVTLIDVTKASQPSVVADVSLPTRSQSPDLEAVAGTAALVASGSGAPVSASVPQTIQIMDFSDPQNPKVAREFTGVTAMSRDEQRGLIFIANADGIWILQKRLAEDPRVERGYANYVLYSH